jgi:hypothetical protein
MAYPVAVLHQTIWHNTKVAGLKLAQGLNNYGKPGYLTTMATQDLH